MNAALQYQIDGTFLDLVAPQGLVGGAGAEFGLAAVPEPSTFLTLSGALGFLVWVRRTNRAG